MVILLQLCTHWAVPTVLYVRKDQRAHVLFIRLLQFHPNLRPFRSFYPDTFPDFTLHLPALHYIFIFCCLTLSSSCLSHCLTIGLDMLIFSSYVCSLSKAYIAFSLTIISLRIIAHQFRLLSVHLNSFLLYSGTICLNTFPFSSHTIRLNTLLFSSHTLFTLLLLPCPSSEDCPAFGYLCHSFPCLSCFSSKDSAQRLATCATASLRLRTIPTYASLIELWHYSASINFSFTLLLVLVSFTGVLLHLDIVPIHVNIFPYSYPYCCNSFLPLN